MPRTPPKGWARNLRVPQTDLRAHRVAEVIEEAIREASLERKELERERAARKQAATAERLGQLLECSPAVIYSFKATGDFAPTFISENIRRVLGYEPSEYLENPDFWRERVHPEDLDRVEADVGQLIGNDGHSLEYRFRRKDGSYCWVNDEQHLVKDANGNPFEIVGSWSDITKRKQAEDESRSAQAMLSELLAVSPSVLYTFEARGDFRPIFISQNLKYVLGYAPSEYMEVLISGGAACTPTISPV